jgi:hypothetical protein
MGYVMANYTEKQEAQIKEFKNKHEKCRKKRGGSCCQFTYLETPTGIGTIDEIRCNVCNKILNFTDVDSW